MPQSNLPVLRHLKAKTRANGYTRPDHFRLEATDEALAGGLVRGGLHEIYAETTAHLGAATGFAAALALRATKGKPLLWARQESLEHETGRLNASGLVELGFDPGVLFLSKREMPKAF